MSRHHDHTNVTRCLFCTARPVITAQFVPVESEKMMFGKLRDGEHVAIDYGICDKDKWHTRRDIRLALYKLAEEGKLELHR
jgi:hypothetical protein